MTGAVLKGVLKQQFLIWKPASTAELMFCNYLKIK